MAKGLGYSIVEGHFSYVRGSLHVNLAIYRPEGVSVDGCAEVSRTILPRMEILFDTQDIFLEVGSPGIDRKIKHPREYGIFTGNGVIIHLKDGTTMIRGIIHHADESSVTVQNQTGETTVLYEQIQKAKLDDTQEVR